MENLSYTHSLFKIKYGIVLQHEYMVEQAEVIYSQITRTLG